jgi:hypothetical protein
MKHGMSLALLLLFATNLWATRSQDIVEETLYQNFKNSIETEKISQKSAMGFTAFEQGLFVDALFDALDEDSSSALKALSQVQTFHFNLFERLRLGLLRIKYKRADSLPLELADDLRSHLLQPESETRILYTLAAYESELLSAGHQDIISLAQAHPRYFDISQDEERKRTLSKDVVADLFYNSPDVSTYMNGEYIRSVKIFIFCRENRIYPCLMVMRDALGEVVRNADGTIWSQPALASSSRGLPSYVRNGNTPAGILTIDSVMPAADQQISFGKFRRMILNFIPKSPNETRLKSLLPATSHDSDWWKPTITARDIGRNLLRIHGTGKINNDPTTPYFPFMRTSGCIAQRENTYGGVNYRDQRLLLDAVMTAMGMVPTYSNEDKVKGMLYLMDLDDESAPVTLDDLALKGIE